MKYVDTKDQISEEKTRLNGGQTAKGQRQTAKDQKSYELIHLILCKKRLQVLS